MGFADKLRLMTILMEDLKTVKEFGIKVGDRAESVVDCRGACLVQSYRCSPPVLLKMGTIVFACCLQACQNCPV